MARAASLKTEIAKIRAEIEQIKQARHPTRWIEVIVEPDEDRSAEIAELEKTHNVAVIQVINPPPRILDPDELTPELKLIKERADLDREIAQVRHDRHNWQQRAIEAKRDAERPMPIFQMLATCKALAKATKWGFFLNRNNSLQTDICP